MGDWDGFAAITAGRAEGWRALSAGQDQHASLNIGRRFGAEREVRLLINGGYVHQEIPGALTLSQAMNDPQSANPTNRTLNYQRDMGSVRGALQTRWRLTPGTVFEGGVYATWKDLDHPIFQVIDHESRNWGVFGRFDWDGVLAGRRADAFYGAAFRSGDLDANQWVNVRGSRGAPSAKSRQNATGLDLFGEGRLFVTDQVAVVAGGSYGRATRDYQSFKLASVTSTFDLTAGKDHHWFAPRLGLLWQDDAGGQIFANLTRSVEPPNFGALSPTVGGFTPLRPQEAWTAEVGTRGRRGVLIWDLALYRALLKRELLTYTVNPGQGIPAATFNAGKTVHQGLEAGLDWMVVPGLRLRQTYAWSDFRFVDDVQYADNRLPVVPEHLYRAELRYDHSAGWFVAPSVEWSLKDTVVDYQNTLRSPSYAVANLGAGWKLGTRASLFIDARNLFDRRYVSNFGAVTDARRVSQAVFFPGEGRSVFGGLTWRY